VSALQGHSSVANAQKDYADLEPAFHFHAYPDPAYHFDADPDADPTFTLMQIRGSGNLQQLA
jgi:hypothetical protein